MNDFLKTMSQLGVESIIDDMTLEEEMNAEIAMEAELDNAFSEMESANIFASISECEAMLTAMAEREVGLESNSGRDVSSIYKEFGLEAIKDVVARKAYSAVSSLKALINRLISWIKNILGFSLQYKKVFRSIEVKAKAMDKNLRKVANKVSEKLKRDKRDYSDLILSFVNNDTTKSINTIIAAFNTGDEKKFTEAMETHGALFLVGASVIGYVINKLISNIDVNSVSAAEVVYGKELIEMLDDAKDKLFSTIDDKSKDLFESNDTDEYEGTACYNSVLEDIATLREVCSSNKNFTLDKEYNECIKKLENIKKHIDKNEKSQYKISKATKVLNKSIELINRSSNLSNKILKKFVKIADDCLTMAKGVYADLV